MTDSASSDTSSTRAAAGKGKVFLFVIVAATLFIGGGTYALGALGAKIGHADTSVGKKRHRSLGPRGRRNCPNTGIRGLHTPSWVKQPGGCGDRRQQYAGGAECPPSRGIQYEQCAG